jgi:hypothetical protein
VGDHDAVQRAVDDPAVPVSPAPAGDIPQPRRSLENGPVPSEADVDSRAETFALVGIVTLATGWFAVSWLVLDSPVVDAVGEAAGGVVAVLVLVSVVGALRRSRRG